MNTRTSVRSGVRTDTQTPTQEDQVRDYQGLQRARYNLVRRRRRMFGQSYNQTLESTIDPERQLEVTRERRARLVPAEVLYSNNSTSRQHRVYQHYSERRILVTERQQENLSLCNTQSYEQLTQSGLQHFHIWIFMIRIHELHRRGEVTNSLVVLRDTRWSNSTSIIGTMEVDLSAGTQLVYMIPDMILSIDDFHNHIEIAIQTHGYDEWQGGESNLLVTTCLTGRLSNTSYMGFQYDVRDAVDHLATNGIVAIPGERLSIEALEGRSWHLRPSTRVGVRAPVRVAVSNRFNRTTSLRFIDYGSRAEPGRYSVDERDREFPGTIRGEADKAEEEFVGVFTQAPRWDTLG